MTYQDYPHRYLEVAERRWLEIVERSPDLEPAVELQRRIVIRSLDLAVVIAQKPPATVDLGPAEVAAKLRRHAPILVEEAILVDADAVVPFVLGFCEDLAAGQAGGAAGRLGEMLDRSEIHVGSLLAASLGRQQEAIRSKAHHVGVAPDLLWLVAELASGPIAHRLQQQFLTELPSRDDDLRSAIGEWNHGFCAACGSWPAFGERILEGPNRSLRCSFCGSAWTYSLQACVYCDEAGDSLIAAAVEPKERSAHLELCRQCGGYLKSIDVQKPTPFQLLAVEDLSTCDLDLGAFEQGYIRPPMHAFVTGDALPCPPPSTA